MARFLHEKVSRHKGAETRGARHKDARSSAEDALPLQNEPCWTRGLLTRKHIVSHTYVGTTPFTTVAYRAVSLPGGFVSAHRESSDVKANNISTTAQPATHKSNQEPLPTVIGFR